MIKKEMYEEYKNNLLNIARLTHKDNSILISFNIKDDKCSNIVNYIQQDGTRDQLKNETFLVDDEFYSEFLEKFIIEYYSNMAIAFNDSIDMNEDGLYTYRVVTEDNDMLSVDGISFECANHLINIVKDKDIVNNVNSGSSDESGFTTIGSVLVLVGAVSISFALLSLIIG